MTTKSPRWMTLSEQIYRTLLILYPADYRRDYGMLMTQLFRDVCRDTYRQQGSAGVILWWCSTFLDLTFTAIQAHRKAGFMMSWQPLGRFSGLLLITGGISALLAAIGQLQVGHFYPHLTGSHFAVLLTIPAFTLISFGVGGLTIRYRDELGTTGRILIMLSACGAFALFVGFIFTMFHPIYSILGFVGMVMHLAGITAFAVFNLAKDVLGVPRLLPLVLGLIPVVPLIAFGITMPTTIVILAAVGILWTSVGYVTHQRQQSLTLAKGT